MANGPGDMHDKNGRPIYQGDLLRTFHFRGKRRKAYWLYHVVVISGDHLDMVPTSHLEPIEKARDGSGRCRLDPERAAAAEIIDGYGGPGRLHFEDRPRLAVKSRTISRQRAAVEQQVTDARTSKREGKVAS